MTSSIPRFLSLALLCLCGWLAFPVSAAAGDRVLDASTADQKPVSLTAYFSVLEDPAGTLALADVRQADIASRFMDGHPPAAALSFGFTTSAYWLRLTLRNPSGQPVKRLLEVSYPLLSSVQFYQPATDGSYRAIVTGAATPFFTRPYPDRFFVFPLTVPEHASQVIYLRVQTLSAMLIPASIWAPDAFRTHTRNDYFVQSGYFGMAAALILFNMLVFFALRDPVYLFYVVFCTGSALDVSVSNGWAKEFLWPDTTTWSDFAIGIIGALTLAALLLFMRRTLNTRACAPRLDRVTRIFVGIELFVAAGLALSVRDFVIPSALMAFATAALVLGAGLYCIFAKKQRIAILFVTAFSMWMLGVLVVSLKTVSILPANVVTMNGWQIGTILEMLLMAFTLAYRFNLIRREAAADVQAANLSLEKRLQARERELMESHKRLREIEIREVLSLERSRLMQDMHDGLGSSLVSALRVVENGKLDAGKITEALKGCIDDLKISIDAMEPAESDLLLLLATFRYRIAPRLEAAGINLLWEAEDIPPLDWLSPHKALHILRIFQEAFTNILKHTHSCDIRVRIAPGQDGVQVTIRDNGRGFDVEHAKRKGGKGMHNQIRRAEAIGGNVRWESGAHGTNLVLWLPLRQPVA